jgi:L,D-transpeptidase YcbB
LSLVVRTVLLFVPALLGGLRVVASQSLSDRVRQRLGIEPRDAIAHVLTRFYGQRGYQPGWVSDSGPLPAAGAVLRVIEAASTDGLDPDDYPLGRIRALMKGGSAPDTLAILDLLLSRTLLAYSTDLARGRIDPAAADSSWTAATRPVDLVAVLETALDSSGGPAQALQALAPQPPPYADLRRALGRYRDIAAHGGWPVVPADAAILRGGQGARVAILRARLAREADLASGDGDSGNVYDTAAEHAVRRFQARHGLDADGIVSGATLAALNVPVEARVRQIALNMERWRWMPRALGERYVMVNSAAFTLEIVDSGRPVMTMPAIVGRRDWPTPIVSGEITGLIFSPVWNIPRTIAREEVLPLAERDPTYLERHRITVSEDSGTFDFEVKQAPGGDNPLGGVKVVFGSRFNVCIHDTPARSLFRERVRPFSHGCIRVERAADLAAYLLRDSVRWTADSVRVRMADSTQQVVRFRSPIPVHLSYWTAWVDDDGTVEFRNDIYDWDAKLAVILRSRRAPRP